MNDCIYVSQINHYKYYIDILINYSSLNIVILYNLFSMIKIIASPRNIYTNKQQKQKPNRCPSCNSFIVNSNLKSPIKPVQNIQTPTFHKVNTSDNLYLTFGPSFNATNKNEPKNVYTIGFKKIQQPPIISSSKRKPIIQFSYQDKNLIRAKSNSSNFSTKKYKQKHLSFMKSDDTQTVKQLRQSTPIKKNIVSIYTQEPEPKIPRILSRKKSLNNSNISSQSLEKTKKFNSSNYIHSNNSSRQKTQNYNDKQSDNIYLNSNINSNFYKTQINSYIQKKQLQNQIQNYELKKQSLKKIFKEPQQYEKQKITIKPTKKEQYPVLFQIGSSQIAKNKQFKDIIQSSKSIQNIYNNYSDIFSHKIIQKQKNNLPLMLNVEQKIQNKYTINKKNKKDMNSIAQQLQSQLSLNYDYYKMLVDKKDSQMLIQ